MPGAVKKSVPAVTVVCPFATSAQEPPCGRRCHWMAHLPVFPVFTVADIATVSPKHTSVVAGLIAIVPPILLRFTSPISQHRSPCKVLQTS